MAGNGTPPTPGSRRWKESAPDSMLTSDGKKRGPALPRFAKNSDGKNVTWHPATRRWWESWRKSPQAIRMMTETDWSFLLDTDWRVNLVSY